jgi:transcriptional regulator with XRE-family HTH domain
MAKSIAHEVSERRETPQGFDYQLRHHFAQIIVNCLDRLEWSQKELAEASGKSAPYISRVIHSGTRFQSDTAGAILHALNERAKLYGLRIEPAIYNPNKFELITRESPSSVAVTAHGQTIKQTIRTSDKAHRTARTAATGVAPARIAHDVAG